MKAARLGVKLRSFFVFSVLLFALIASALEECPFGLVNDTYPGSCARYVDANGDGICDYSQPETGGDSNPDAGGVSLTNASNGSSSDSEEASLVTAQQTNSLNRYNALAISAGMILLYAMSFAISRMRKITLPAHRRIWNVLLLVTFAVSGISGILLAFAADGVISPPGIRDLVFWHTEFGIAMALISAFHVAWHWAYFRKLLPA